MPLVISPRGYRGSKSHGLKRITCGTPESLHVVERVADALDAAEWDDGEVLALGTSPQGAIGRVFLGSKDTKIVRHSTVPVLVLPS